MRAAFHFELEHQILPGLCSLGRFDGKNPSLALATVGGKVLIYSPYETESQNTDSANDRSVRYVNFNRKITALATGRLDVDDWNEEVDGGDLLLIGTESSLVAYNVFRNADQFFSETPDGCNTIILTKLSPTAAPIVLAGGNCSILGFDSDGDEVLWTVTGDNVSSLATLDIDNDNQTEIVVGSDDFEIRVFRKEELIHELTEADRVTFLCAMKKDFFAYGLSNGSIGVYCGPKSRAWRVKTKHKLTALLAFDLDGDGVPEVISGWDHGLVTARRMNNGEVIFRETFNAPIAGLLKGDYRQRGKEQLIIVTESGEVIGYDVPEDSGALVALNEAGQVKDTRVDIEVLQKLQEKKLELSTVLRNLEGKLGLLKRSSETGGSAAVAKLTKETELEESVVQYGMESDEDTGFVNLRVSLKPNTEASIANVVAVDQASTVFEKSDVVAASPSLGSKEAVLPLRLNKMLKGKLRLQTHLNLRGLGIGTAGTKASTSASSNQLAVVEVDIEVPKFVAFRQITETRGREKPKGCVVVNIPETTTKLAEFVTNNFLLPHPVVVNAEKFKALFVSALPPPATNGPEGAEGQGQPSAYAKRFRTSGSPLYILAQTSEDERSIAVSVHCNSMDLAAEIVQELARYFNLDEMRADVDFPEELEYFEGILDQVTQFNSSRNKLGADMAEDSQRVKALVVRAEDCRLMNDMVGMRKAYTELHAVTNQLTGGYNIRAANHQGLLAALKEVNQMIQRAANLRVGRAKSVVISESRAALKQKNMQALLRILTSK